MQDLKFLKQISLGPSILNLMIFNENPLVECENEHFSSLLMLCQHLPLLCDPTYMNEFAEIANFLWKGLEFRVVEHIQDFQKSYVKQIELESRCPGDIFPYRLSDFKIFDVSIMHSPMLKKGQLLYFVYQISTGIPYRVVCPFPYIGSSTLVHYQILPLKSEPSSF